MPIRAFFILVIVTTGLPLRAQNPSVLVYGTVRDFSTRDSIPFPIVYIQDASDDAVPTPVVTNARGRYEIELNEEKAHWIIYTALGKVAKFVEIDTRGPTPVEWEGGYAMNIDMVLMDSLPDVDYSILQTPFGRSYWNKRTATFDWDVEYTAAMRKRVVDLMDAYKAAQEKRKQ